VGFVAGVPSRHGEAVPVAAFEEHVFGACLVKAFIIASVSPG
jgi:hypothetical protein